MNSEKMQGYRLVYQLFCKLYVHEEDMQLCRVVDSVDNIDNSQVTVSDSESIFQKLECHPGLASGAFPCM